MVALVAYFTILLVFPIILTMIILKHNQARPKLPPGPKQWPIIGNFYLLGNKPLYSLANLAKKYGPIMSLKIGSVTTIVISSSNVASAMFLTYDLALSSRHAIAAARVSEHNTHSMMWLPICPQWRTLRKISTLHFFTAKQMEASRSIRLSKVQEMVEYAGRCCELGRALDIKDTLFVTLINFMSNILFSADLAGYGDIDLCTSGFKQHLMENCEVAGETNLCDVFPVIEGLDLQGLGKRAGDSFDKVVGVFEKIIEERLKDHNNVGGCFKGDVLDSFLELVKDHQLSLDSLKHLLFDLVSAAVETTSSTVKWSMTELIRHQEKMEKAQKEIDQVINKTNSSIQELDTVKLTYMHAILQETLRLHPPAPLLLPRKAVKDVELWGYLVPRNAQIWVNVWLIGRDPTVWSNPDKFNPERFLETEEFDAKSGRDFNMLPFGEGRRKCPGLPLAYKIMPLILANLLYSFNWKISDGVNINDISVEGVTFQRAQPLQVIPLPR